MFAVDPLQANVTSRGPRRMLDRVRKLDVLADEPDCERNARSADAIGERLPFREVRLLCSSQAELLDDDLAEPGLLEH